MRFLEPHEASVLSAFSALATGNPFLPERVENERRALGPAFTPLTTVWHEGADFDAPNPNVDRLFERAAELAPELRVRLTRGARAGAGELGDYQGLIFYLLYYRYIEVFQELVERGQTTKSTTAKVRAYARYRDDAKHFLAIPGVRLPLELSLDLPPEHLFAWGYQVRRAFEGTFRGIHGGSMPAARLRAAVWQSIFTHDSQRYGRSLYQRMGDLTTLVLGESGTGKELVARAIGLARYVPFDPETGCFQEDPGASFEAVNLSALSPSLIESELFGHRRGAFTGALENRVGWLEACPPFGSVFLDEIGELEGPIQVKLLRVLQARGFQRVGETHERHFEGKIITATNRDLSEEIAAGRFRQDLYYRLCSDVIRTPTLREQIADSPEELRDLIAVLARRIVGDEDHEALTEETARFVEGELGLDYAWPGNVRELEQCVRNVLIRGRYEPPGLARPGEDLSALLREGKLSADDLLRRYCTEVYARVGSYEEASRRLGLDRRTVKAKVDTELLEQLRG
ncbi:MAG: sigma-54-dependent Fis family transcriptional regulator [Deltaproteobacteria bacterium]|nr:sigma-54-dependent Fis family transcriptional regulator [Deltaproteobacteria bacterium]MBW2417747.1 sigma-54-dependent Fis family transcriptional regulator [Deltaproteobacteria bacterium]